MPASTRTHHALAGFRFRGRAPQMTSGSQAKPAMFESGCSAREWWYVQSPCARPACWWLCQLQGCSHAPWQCKTSGRRGPFAAAGSSEKASSAKLHHGVARCYGHGMPWRCKPQRYMRLVHEQHIKTGELEQQVMKKRREE